MKVSIVKYNAGNIYSVVNALRRLGVEPLITDDAETLASSDRVLFPGQGEARTTMSYIREHRLDDIIRNLRQPVLYVYFIHSYYVPECQWTIASADYIQPFSAALRKDNFYATQFHPEKSGKVGERILRNFLEAEP